MYKNLWMNVKIFSMNVTHFEITANMSFFTYVVATSAGVQVGGGIWMNLPNHSRKNNPFGATCGGFEQTMCTYLDVLPSDGAT